MSDIVTHFLLLIVERVFTYSYIIALHVLQVSDHYLAAVSEYQALKMKTQSDRVHPRHHPCKGSE